MPKRALLLLTACCATAALPASPAMAAPADSATASAAATNSAKSGITIRTSKIAGFGRVLVDGRGMPLYIFTRDRRRKSRCYGDCARAWPVAFANGRPRASGGASKRRLGTTKRRDGKRQVTYRGRPLYYYVDDRPGVALCHNVREFGGLWLLVRANGKRV